MIKKVSNNVQRKKRHSRIRNKIVGKQLCLFVNIQALADNPDYGEIISSFFKPIFGNAKTLVYHY